MIVTILLLTGQAPYLLTLSNLVCIHSLFNSPPPPPCYCDTFPLTLFRQTAGGGHQQPPAGRGGGGGRRGADQRQREGGRQRPEQRQDGPAAPLTDIRGQETARAHQQL